MEFWVQEHIYKRGWICLINLARYFRMTTVTGQWWMRIFGRNSRNWGGSPTCFSRKGQTLRRLGGSMPQWFNLSYFLSHICGWKCPASVRQCKFSIIGRCTGYCSKKLHLQSYLEKLWSEMGYFGLLGNNHILFIILLYPI